MSASAVRVFVGVEPKTVVAYQVLAHTIRQHASVPVEIIPMIGPAWEYPLAGIKVGTGFSLRRWMIPAACGWAGRAIYLDSDQIVFHDINELWDYADAPGDAVAWCSYQPDKYSKTPWPQTSVMVIDCARAAGHWGFDIDRVLTHLRARPDRQTYADLMHATWLTPSPARIPDFWNALNVYTPKGKPKHTRLLHYTKEPEQPWYKPDHYLASLWEQALTEAIRHRAVSESDFREALASWGRKDDWRSTNGLHPKYAAHLPLFSVTGG